MKNLYNYSLFEQNEWIPFERQIHIDLIIRRKKEEEKKTVDYSEIPDKLKEEFFKKK